MSWDPILTGTESMGTLLFISLLSLSLIPFFFFFFSHLARVVHSQVNFSEDGHRM